MESDINVYHHLTIQTMKKMKINTNNLLISEISTINSYTLNSKNFEIQNSKNSDSKNSLIK